LTTITTSTTMMRQDTPPSQAPASNASASAPSAPPVAVSAPSGPAVSVEDVPIRATDVLNVILAQKLKKLEEVPPSKSIKELVGGKSTLQNEILGDIQLAFSSAPKKGEEPPLEELGSALGVSFSGTSGKYTSGLVSRMIGGKMPGGFNSSAISSHLSKTWGLGFSRADAFCCLELPSSLLSDLYLKLMPRDGWMALLEFTPNAWVSVCRLAPLVVVVVQARARRLTAKSS
jgi:3-oxoacyl-ACP reductase-like protein